MEREDDTMAYDKAKWHAKAVRDARLPEEQAYVHTGLFLTWIIDHDLYSEEFLDDVGEGIPAVKDRRVTGPSLYREGDGVLAEDMLNDEGNAFTRYYYSPVASADPHYLKDLHVVFALGPKNAYEVEDSWDTYRVISPMIDAPYREWVQAGRPSSPRS